MKQKKNFINLRKTLLVDLIYLKKAIGDKRFERETAIINSKDSINSLKSKHKYVAIEAENYELLEYINKDLVINIASFQEMSKQVIDNYFKFIYNKSGKHFYFYLCNREEKELPDGEKIKFKNYNFEFDDQILENELCPWHQYFYMKYPPFFKKYGNIFIFYYGLDLFHCWDLQTRKVAYLRLNCLLIGSWEYCGMSIGSFLAYLYFHLS